jgi:hypothetical protein
MAQAAADPEISQRLLNMARAYRSQADVLKAKKKVRQKAALIFFDRRLARMSLG